jgi:hypothetical protein
VPINPIFMSDLLDLNWSAGLWPACRRDAGGPFG